MSSPVVFSLEEGASQSSVPAQRVPAQRVPAQRVPASLGAGAAVFMLTLLLFGVGGAVWGWLRPTITGRIENNQGLDVVAGQNAEFTAYGAFALSTLGLGALLAFFAVIGARRHYGLPMMAWVSFCALLGSAWFAFVGHVLGVRRVPALQPESLNMGDLVTYLPSFDPGIALAAGAYAAMFTYWILALLIREDVPERHIV